MYIFILFQACFALAYSSMYFFLLHRHGMGLSTGIDLETLVDVGEYICGVLDRPTQSKVSRAILSKRKSNAEG